MIEIIKTPSGVKARYAKPFKVANDKIKDSTIVTEEEFGVMLRTHGYDANEADRIVKNLKRWNIARRNFHWYWK